MLIPSCLSLAQPPVASLSRRVNANSQRYATIAFPHSKLIKKGEC